MPLNLKPVEKKELHLKPKKKTKLSLTPVKEKLHLKPVAETLPFGLKQEFSKMTPMGKVVDIIGRPGYGVKSVINQLAYESDFADKDLLEKYISLTTRPKTAMEMSRAFKRGFTGKERIMGNQLWGRAGIKGVPLLGFATEIATDPLMWFGGAGYKGLGKLISAPFKAAKKIPIVAKTTQAIGTKASPYVSRLRHLFATKSKDTAIGKFIDEKLLKRQYLAGKEVMFGRSVRNVIQNISRKTKRSIDDVQTQIVNLIEQPNLSIKAPKESRILANVLRSHFENMLTKELKAGVPITHLAGGARNIQYFPRITTKEAKQYLKQAKIGNSKVWNPKLANALKRRTRDFTLDEFNGFVAKHGTKAVGGKQLEQFFLKKPSVAVAVRGTRSAKAITSAEFLDDVAKQFGMKADKAPEWWMSVSDDIARANKKLKGLKFDPEVMDEITRTYGKYFTVKSNSMFGKAFDRVQSLWKIWTLAPFPKYHLRNMVSNFWNNYLADVSNPKYYAKAQAIQMYRKYGTRGKMGKWALKNLKTNKITTQQADDIIQQGEKLGVFGHGWYAADIESLIEKQIKSGFRYQPLKLKLKKLAKGEVITEKGMAAGTTIENNARLAHFIAKYTDEGMDAHQAALSVKKYLFDYSDLTSFEKQVMKRVFPFYTWTRKNLPLQIESFIQKPQKYAKLTPLFRNREARDLARLEVAKPWLYERLPIEVKRTNETVTYLPIEGLLAAGDLAKAFRPHEIFKELLSPYIKTPLELAFNKSLYFESKIKRYDRQTREFLKMDVPVRLKYALTTVLPQARLANEVNKIVTKRKRKEKLDFTEQLLHQTLSSVYKINLEDLRDRALFRIKDKVDELNSGLFWADRYERGSEYKRIKETIEGVKEWFKKIKERR